MVDDHFTSRGNSNGTIESNVLKVARLEAKAKKERTIGEKIAEYVAAFCGSMSFVYIHMVWFGAWIIVNAATRWVFDPFPFTFLTLCVSLEAIFLSTFVLSSQKRSGAEADRRADLMLHVGLLTEHEVTRALQMLDTL